MHENTANSIGLRAGILSFIKWPALLLFIFISTPFEFQEVGQHFGITFLYKNLSAVLLLLLFLLRADAVIVKTTLITATVILLYFLALNVFYPKNYVFLTFGLMSAGLIIATISVNDERNKNLLIWILTGYLYVHLFGLIIAGALYFLTGEVWDLHGIMFPFSQARVGFFHGFPRVAGFHQEPGTYSNYLYLILVARILLTGKVSDRLNVLVILTSIFTFSVWAFFAAFAFFIAVAVEVFSRSGVYESWLKVFGCLVGVFVLYFILSDFGVEYLHYVETRTEIGAAGDYSATNRALIFRHIWEVLMDGRVVFIGSPVSKSLCSSLDCSHGQALGSLFSLIYYFGFVPVILVVVLAGIRVYYCRGSAALISMIPIVFCKASIFEMSLWIFVGIFLFGCQLGVFDYRELQRNTIIRKFSDK